MRRRRKRLGSTRSRRAAQACLNGGRSPDEHPRVPITPGEVAADGAAAVVAGAEALRDIVRVPVSITTGPSTVPDPDERLRAVRAWSVVPDFACVDFGDEGALDLAGALLDRYVGVEAAVATPQAAQALVASGLAPRCHSIIIEPYEQLSADACATIQRIEQGLDGVAPRVPRLLHGYAVTAWDLVAEAGRLGYDTRMGFEDTIRTPDGMIARDNGELIRAALQLHREAELESDVVDIRPAIAPGL